jgi:hypothetical protein
LVKLQVLRQVPLQARQLAQVKQQLQMLPQVLAEAQQKLLVQGLLKALMQEVLHYPA